ncbi:valine--tRNA ligase [candidate division WOR-3 bacterium]|nr:valine--tRNA ligase [candidate division WOR-3 bacterium]
MQAEFPKRYDPKGIEERLYKAWVQEGLFTPKPDEEKERFVIVIPPPNVTGKLTLGHMLDNELQDILVRFHSLAGKEVLWVAGFDHAGIATQVVVEQKLAREGKSKEDLGREGFVKEVWRWANKHRDIIRSQLERMGCALDFSRERFTLDEGLARAVRTVFAKLYDKGLIYRGLRIVNWCPRCHTAISNEETSYEERQGSLWYIRYPLEDGSGHVTVATTRPETMLGDTAVAVNPSDDRYRHLVGKSVILPLMNREIPVIADDAVQPDFGTGAVKVTPSHDAADYEIGQRHELAKVRVISETGVMSDEAGAYAGKDRYAARKEIVSDLKSQGLLEKTEPYRLSVATCSRCGTVIEPLLSEQWFLKMKPLAEPAIKAVQDGVIRFYPERWKNLYFHWMRSIQDWCISRQLWWGHRIPVYTCSKCGHRFASVEEPDACPKCGTRELKQDPDVLDTWFSSWLWPFSVMGWPDETEDLKRYYPTSTLVSGWDIIYLWVARMIMAGLEFTGQKPFDNVFFHVMIRDERGRKMSKSLGNSPDPFGLIDKYGADALRFGLMLITPQEQDVCYSEERIKVGRNFANKLWNSARLLAGLMDGEEARIPQDPTPTERWMLARLAKASVEVKGLIARHDLYNAAKYLYNFYWHSFCDWGLEFAKLAKREGNRGISCALYCFRSSLAMLHPYMPFITEELWERFSFAEHRLFSDRWPEVPPQFSQSPQSVDAMTDLITAVRTMRSELGIAKEMPAPVAVVTSDDALYAFLEANMIFLAGLAGIESISRAKKKPHPSTGAVFSWGQVYLPLAEFVSSGKLNLEAERVRLSKEIGNLEAEIERINGKLSNEEFIKKAPDAVVSAERGRLETFVAKIARLRELKEGLA